MSALLGNPHKEIPQACTSKTSSNSTRLFLILKKYFSTFIWKAKSFIDEGDITIRSVIKMK